MQQTTRVQKADAAESNAIVAAADDATTKADAAETNTIEAANDATTNRCKKQITANDATTKQMQRKLMP
jgi:formate-dependent nitrite reductase cytochrome c552 subunit